MPDAKRVTRSIPIVVMALLAVVVTATVLLFYLRARDAPPGVASTDAAALDDRSAPDPDKLALMQRDPGFDPVFVDARLSEAQDRIQRLEGEVASLHEQQESLEATLADQADALRQMQTTAAGLVDAGPASGSASVPDWSQTAESLNDDSLDADLKALGATQADPGWLITLDESQIRFQPRRADLPAKRSDALEAIADVLVRQPSLRASIEVHTDNKGIASQNLELSRERARSIKEALVAMGVSPDRLQTTGRGGSSPVGDNRTVASRQRNRRVEISLIPENGGI